MPKKKFDTSKPHKHICPNCHKYVYCAQGDCEITERAECQECRNGYTFRTLEGQPGYYRQEPMRFDGDTEIRRRK